MMFMFTPMAFQAQSRGKAFNLRANASSTKYEHTIGTCDLALGSGSTKFWSKLARSTVYHGDSLSIHPPRSGLALRQPIALLDW